MPRYTVYIGHEYIPYRTEFCFLYRGMPMLTTKFGTTNGCYFDDVNATGPKDWNGSAWVTGRTLTLASNEYVTGISFSGGAMGNQGIPYADATIYLSDANGNNKNQLGRVILNSSEGYDSSGLNKSGVSYKNLKGATLALSVVQAGAAHEFCVRGKCTVTITTAYDSFDLIVKNKDGGNVRSEKVNQGTTVTLSPIAVAGYTFTGWTRSDGGTVSGNSFTMPANNVTVTPNYSRNSYTITKAVSPAGAGSISAAGSAGYGDTVSVSQTPATGYTFSRWTLSSGGSVSNGRFTMPNGAVTLTAVYTKNSYAITKAVSPAGAGSITAPAGAGYNDTVTVSQTPATGYTFSRWTLSSGGNVSNNRFTMPNGAVTLTAVYTRNSYQITARVNPAGAGSVTVQGTAGYGDSVAVSQTAANGYYFSGWTLSSGGSVSNGRFTMPNGAVTVTANYLRRSVGSLNKNTVRGGETVTLNISSESAAYTHQYRINFGSGMDTGWVNVAARVSSVNITIPASWANQIPTSASKGSGTLSIRTYSGSTLIGTYESGGLTYQVPADANPTIGAITVEVQRTVDGITYANVGDVYTQGKCGVHVSVAACTPKYSASISSIRIWISGYDGQKFDRTILAASGEMSSGILTIRGETKVNIQVTDSRGLSSTITQTIQVEPYSSPIITGFRCWRVNAAGDADETGEFAQYSFSYLWSHVGTNSVSTALETQGATETNPAGSGWLLPSARKTYSILQAHEIQLSVTDSFGTTTLPFRLESGAFAMHFSANGESVAFGHAVSHTPSSGFEGTFEIGADKEFYYGNRTLKEYILDVVNGNV